MEIKKKAVGFVSVFLFITVALLYFSFIPLTGFAVAQFEYVPSADVTEDAALEALLRAEADVKDVASLKITTYFLNDTILVAKRYFIGDMADRLSITVAGLDTEEKRSYVASLLEVAKTTPKHEIKPKNFSEVLRLTQLIAFKKEQAYRIIDIISLAEEKEGKYEQEGADTAASISLIAQAKTSLLEERFDEAESLLDDANLRLDQARLQEARFRSIFKGTQSFFQLYWRQSLLVFIVLALTTPFIVLGLRRIWTIRKLSLLKKELQTLQGLLVKAQEDCFKYRTITTTSYKIKADSYKERINEIQRTIPVLEAIARGEKYKEKKEAKGVVRVK